jgi:hypothetical protein
MLATTRLGHYTLSLRRPFLKDWRNLVVSAGIFEKGASFYNPKTAVEGKIKLSRNGQLGAA